jgi:hypothetical protein
MAALRSSLQPWAAAAAAAGQILLLATATAAAPPPPLSITAAVDEGVFDDGSIYEGVAVDVRAAATLFLSAASTFRCPLTATSCHEQTAPKNPQVPRCILANRRQAEGAYFITPCAAFISTIHGSNLQLVR